MVSTRLEKLLEENRLKQKLDLESFLAEMKIKWDSNKYYYDEEEARKIFKFISLLKNDKGTSRKFTVLKFQFEIITEILCVKHKKNNLRRFREAHINIARKNSKSFLIGIILSYLFFCQPKIFGALFIITGNTTKQAAELYNTFKAFVRSNKALLKRCKILDSTKTIIRKDNGNKLIVLSNDGGGADSYAVYSCALDEIHEYASDEIYGKLKTGQGIWDEPLTFTITTASSGEDETNLEMQLYKMAKAMEEGKGEDETFYYKIYEAEKDCKIDDYMQWFNANPALGEFRKPDDIVNFANRVKLMPLQENMFRRMFLNQHVATDHIKSAINMELWDKCTAKIDIGDLKGWKCWCGLDLSSKNDVTAFVLVFYNEEIDKFIIYPYLYTPKATMVERQEKDNNPYVKWEKQGDLTALEGKYINFERLLDNLYDLDSEFIIEQIGFDRWGSATIINRLEEKWDVIPIGQGSKTMTQVINDFENLLIDERLIIANNEVFRFMAKNCVAKIDENNGVMFSKKRSEFKIDGIIAMLMGLLLAIEENEINHYDPIDALDKMGESWDD
ncbi:terminase large subunit [Clostridium tunisiense]|uniref:terminase large subunit n=1 Tax=Clostridium tunisiense TaxID=219748 RepID=UPI0002FB6262|nr:terminase TerL endonuclease subunit [Clostridium tunisiense]